MEHPDTTKLPKVRPKALLLALLIAQLGAALFCLYTAWKWNREASLFAIIQREEHDSASDSIRWVSTNTDIVKLRTVATSYYRHKEDEWGDRSYRLHYGSSACLDAVFLQVFICTVLAFALYGLRSK